MAKPEIRWFTFLRRLLFYATIAWALGFGLFYLQVPAGSDPSSELYDTDAYIVLTGGGGRIDAGVALLKARPEKRLLISGVNPIVEAAEISKLTGIEPALFDCCIDLDHLAKNTAANAYLTAKWAAENQTDTLTLITADYHIQRSEILFAEAMPGKHIQSFSVKTDAPVSFLLREYHKYLFTVMRRAFRLKPDIRVATHEEQAKPSIKD